MVALGELLAALFRMLVLIRGWSSMKRKIAAIFAADIAGY